MVIQLGNRVFSTLQASRAYVSAILDGYIPGQILNEIDTAAVADLLDRHPNCSEKIGCGLRHFEVRLKKFGAKCFHVVRVDGTVEDFSYRKCLMKA